MVRWGNMDICRLLLERGADVNFSPPSSGQIPLIATARHGHTDAVKLFLEAGVWWPI
ncbi:MAG: ankyrin repeat domain-containing protein [Verrucomicrobiales bacterium]